MKPATSNLVYSLGLTRASIKSHQEKRWEWSQARGALQILEFPFNISATNEGTDFKIGRQVSFAKAHHKISPRRKIGRGHGLGEHIIFWGSPLIFLQWLKLAISNLVRSLGLPRPIINSHPEEKWAWPWAREAPQNWPIIKSHTEEKRAWPWARGAL